MRFVLYNIRYGTGSKAHGLVRSSRRNLNRIAVFLADLEPDLVGLVEVDYGSYRMRRENQVEILAAELGHYHSYSTKYDQHSLWRHVPVLNRQGNAFLARDRIRNETFHFFDQGMKRLVMELELEQLVIYLVHLSLGARTRHQQLSALYALIARTPKPFLVAGDFNLLWGEGEIDLFLAATGLRDANVKRLPTYPSRQPNRHLDFVLYSSGIDIHAFDIPRVSLSDHLPLVVDFDVEIEQERRLESRESVCSCKKFTQLKLAGTGT